MGEHRIRGLAQPIEIFRVQGLGVVRNPIESVGAAGTDAADRPRPRDHSAQGPVGESAGGRRADRASHRRAGPGQVAARLHDEAARSGASRHGPVERSGDFARAIGRADPPVVEWRCSRRLQNTSLYPATEFFERFLGLGLEDTPAARFERLVRHLRDYDLARTDLVPLFASLLSLPTDDRFPPLGLPPVREREETFRALVEWLQRTRGPRPVLFVVEDLHWADASTLEFLQQFFAEGPHDRILTVLTFRPEFQPPWPTAAHQTSLALTCSDTAPGRGSHGRKTGVAVPEALADQVYGRTGGVPLFVEEYTRMLQESGIFDSAGGGRNRRSRLPCRAKSPPPSRTCSWRGSIEWRATGKSPRLQPRSAENSATSYSTPSPPWTRRFSSTSSTNSFRPRSCIPKVALPRCRYVFKHALLEDALYNSLVQEKRQEFHRRIAEVLEAGGIQTVDTPPELIAHHFTEAGLAEKAIRYWLKAGLRSRERSAEVEAISHLSRGLKLLATMPESAERDTDESELLSPLGTAYIASRGYAAPEVGPVFRRARELCERVGPPEQLFALMLGIWEWHTVRGRSPALRGSGRRGNGIRPSARRPGHLHGSPVHGRGDHALSRGFRRSPGSVCDGCSPVRRP